MAQALRVFLDYDDDTLTLATDPGNRTCIQRTHKFPPSLFELSEALDKAVAEVKTRRFIAARTSRGFHWVTERTGFYNAQGERFDPAKHLPKEG